MDKGNKKMLYLHMKDFEIVSDNITKGADGTYRWSYEMSMYKNPTILITIYKVLGITLMICYLLIGTIVLISDGWEDLWNLTKGFSIVIPIFLVLGLIGYLIVALMYGGVYHVEFELNPKRLVHRQIKAQRKKSEKLGCLLAFLGVLAKKPGRVGQGLLVASHNETTSILANVESVKGKRRRNVIYLNQLFSKNQVYVYDEDYDAVLEYLVAHCTKAKVK